MTKTKPYYELSDVSTVSLRRGLAYRFNLTVSLSDGSVETLQGCLAGFHPVTGPWCNPPRGARGYNVVSWNRKRQEIILELIGKDKLAKLKPNEFGKG